ncbi:hypothetical protein COT51_00670 [candidate division WWE3 bacterium CG08_land_8_20_14_0_20_41_15]|uniref:DNA 3'-5' helicase n=1 Tax=candidate division WWE3 bacterium CG08_land_8_20_14_0_20_41_15 TaxID=1975086 RepID=A0A2H0XA53_UNCKA|nr:MAG: hypothetical protein COT51_00670 [candidate division WWE3 bacterium CG08_land_8_20_14_0_20_41_15]
MSFILNLEQYLNKSQIEAATIKDGPVLVIAGAGTGKTRVLEFRTSFLVDSGIPDNQILLLTFTRKAAAEMLRRAAERNENCRNIQGGTFHSFAASLLRKHASLLNFPNDFTILDKGDSEDLINVIRGELNLGEGSKRFPKKGTIMNIISSAQNREMSLETIVEAEYPHFEDDLKALTQIAHNYKARKQKSGLMDYNDLLIYLNLLLISFPKVKEGVQDMYRYIMVDEYQDTNAVQGDIVKNLADQHRNILAVGDDMQSIYKFRGATFKNIIRFPKDFPETRIIKLEQNYRSVQPILDASNRVIDQVKGEHFAKSLFTRESSGEKPLFIEFPDPMEEASWIARKVLELRETGIQLNQIAILFRASFTSNELEVELQSRGIPYVKYGGLKFMEASHVKDLISIIKASQNFKDELSWIRTAQLLPKVGPAKANQIFLSVSEKGAEEGLKPYASGNPAGGAVEELLYIINLSREEGVTPKEVMDEAVKMYRPLLQENYDDWDKRGEDLTSLIEISKKYKTITALLEDLALEPPNESVSGVNADHEDETRLILSTIHSAKGLEWNTVFVLGAQEGVLPHYKAVEDPEELEEERRMFYVAITRAKKRLYLTMSHGHSTNPRGWGLELPSRFVLPLLDSGEVEMQEEEKNQGRTFGKRLDYVKDEDSYDLETDRSNWQI